MRVDAVVQLSVLSTWRLIQMAKMARNASSDATATTASHGHRRPSEDGRTAASGAGDWRTGSVVVIGSNQSDAKETGKGARRCPRGEACFPSPARGRRAPRQPS